jgi:CheY-like chemotaxis protein
MENKTILVVDDEQDLRDSLKDILEGEGYTVLEANNGEVGLARALEAHPDLILLDLMMPEINGIGMLKRLRQDSWGKDATVILLTALEDANSVSQAVEAGGNDYLIKSSVSLDDIIKKVKQHLAGYN